MNKVMSLNINLQGLWLVCSAFYIFLIRREILNAKIKIKRHQHDYGQFSGYCSKLFLRILVHFLKLYRFLSIYVCMIYNCLLSSF